MKDSIRICYIGDAQSVHMKKWAEHFSRAGYDVHLISDSSSEMEGVTLHQLEKRGKSISFYKRIGQTKRFVKEIQPDILHAHFVTGYGLFGAKTGFHPFIVSPWGSDIVSLPENSSMFKRMVSFVLKSADIIHCGDEFMKERIIQLGGDASKVRLIAWGIDSKRFSPQDPTQKDTLNILFLRRSEKVYNVELFLRSLPEVLAEHPDVHITMLNSGSELGRTKEIISELDLGSKITFVDEVANETMPDLLNTADIYVDTYYSELPGAGVVMTTLEAMSCGIPIVIPDTSGSEPYVQDGINGVLYKGNDERSLSQKLNRMIEDEDLRSRIGSSAREFILEKQNWDQNMVKIDSLYKELISGVDL